MKSYIKRVGIELEGGWADKYRLTGGTWQLDGSVRVQARHVGEYVSRPILPVEIAPWVTTNYPQAVNSSCGMHVHISVSSKLRYAHLMDKCFVRYVLKRFQQWGKSHTIKSGAFWSRLRGGNEYCQRPKELYIPDEQVRAKAKGRAPRYSVVNYCYGLHKTVELRLLPMFKDPLIGITAIHFYLETVDKYFFLLSKRSRESQVEIAVPDLKPEFYSSEVSIPLDGGLLEVG